MSTDLDVAEKSTVVPAGDFPMVDLGLAEKVIAGLRGRLVGVTADTPAGYQAVSSGIHEVRRHRTKLERDRKNLKRSALEYGRGVDSRAKELTARLLEIEEPLRAERKRVDDEAESARQEKLEEKRIAEEVIAAANRADQEKRERAEREDLDRQRAEIESERVKQMEDIRRERNQQMAEIEKIKADQVCQQLKIDEQRESLDAALSKKPEEEAGIKQGEILDEKKKDDSPGGPLVRGDTGFQAALGGFDKRTSDREKLVDLSNSLDDIRLWSLPSMTTRWGELRLEAACEKLYDCIMRLRDGQ